MNFELHITPGFLKSLKSLSKRHKSLKQDFALFAESLKANPFQGVEISPSIRKIRMAITSKGKGKAGGARIITYTIIASEEDGEIYLIDIYDKSDYSTVDVSVIKSIVDEL